MSKLVLITLVIALCCISQFGAQTFQYSRGWTNGKRSSASTTTDLPPSLRQMMPNPLLMTSTELNNRERLFQHIIKNPCDVRMALLASHNGFKFQSDDFTPPAAELLDDDELNRFKRELGLHN